MKPLSRISNRLIVALDVSTASQAISLAEELHGSAGMLKIGLELFAAEGPPLVKTLSQWAPIFLDLKLHDIPSTVTKAVRTLLALNPRLMTIHASGGSLMMKEVAQLVKAHRKQGGETSVLGVTVLTSFNESMWTELGHSQSTEDATAHLAALSYQSGLDGIVCSPQNASSMRAAFSSPFLLVCPGIRLSNDHPSDQQRLMEPQAALKAGADWLVVGRPITESASPKAMAEAYLSSMES